MAPRPLCRETHFRECSAENDKVNVLRIDLPRSSIALFMCPTMASITRVSSEGGTRLVSSEDIDGGAFKSESPSPPRRR